MKIGIMSDSHDRIDAIEKAITYFNNAGVEHVLHAGDLVSPFVVPRFAKLKAKLHYVYGNNEGDRSYITEKLGEIGINPLGNFASLDFGGKKIALLHGTHEEIVDALASAGSFDFVIRGHTHRAGITGKKPMIINPGETCGYLTGRQTIVVLDLEKLGAEIVQL